ncbi:MAG: spermidine/putrescine ABC transporter substrate-binding protein [Kiritimatiellae bacterium]|nr:spermidine/putrescine ABC transporter substrate-binding protein [Kiritimatiellia bacterium]
MVKNIVLTLCAMLGLVMSGCGETKPVLNIYTWNEYIDMDIVREFEAANNCQVVIGIFDSNEAMWAKLQHGASGFDVVFPSSYMVKIMSDAGALEKIDKSKLPNLKNIDPAYLSCSLDANMTYGVPYMVTYTGFAYDKSKVQGEVEPSWNVFASRPELKGRMTLLADMRETIGAALKYKGYSVNTKDPAQLAEARDVVVEWKRNIAKFENEQYKVGLASGEFYLVHGYSGDIGQLQLEDENIVFVLPKEGFSLSCDEMVILKDSQQKELAYKFINFLHDGQIAARNMEYTTYWCPNKTAAEFLPDEVKNNPTIFPREEDIVKGEVIGDLGDALELYTKTWDEIKNIK